MRMDLIRQLAVLHDRQRARTGGCCGFDPQVNCAPRARPDSARECPIRRGACRARHHPGSAPCACISAKKVFQRGKIPGRENGMRCTSYAMGHTITGDTGEQGHIQPVCPGTGLNAAIMLQKPMRWRGPVRFQHRFGPPPRMLWVRPPSISAARRSSPACSREAKLSETPPALSACCIVIQGGSSPCISSD